MQSVSLSSLGSKDCVTSEKERLRTPGNQGLVHSGTIKQGAQFSGLSLFTGKIREYGIIKPFTPTGSSD